MPLNKETKQDLTTNYPVPEKESCVCALVKVYVCKYVHIAMCV